MYFYKDTTGNTVAELEEGDTICVWSLQDSKRWWSDAVLKIVVKPSEENRWTWAFSDENDHLFFMKDTYCAIGLIKGKDEK